MRFTLNFLLIISLVLVLGCKSEKPQAEEENTGSTVNNNKELTYTAPDGWVSEAPKSRMRLAQYRLPGQEGAGDAELAVFVFPGTGGSVNANLERWYGQFKQPDGADSGEKADVQKKKVNGLDVTIVYVTGTYLQSASPMMMGGPVNEVPESAMLAAIVETGKDPWFFKAVGPQKTIDYWRPSFDTFVQSFKWK